MCSNYTLLRTHITIMEPIVAARAMHHLLWREETSGEGGCVRYAHHIHPQKAACGSG